MRFTRLEAKIDRIRQPARRLRYRRAGMTKRSALADHKCILESFNLSI